ncbi:hypothetical protein [Teredinibacter turnerae]|uniref:hypothetical protein n=1 Tax=Teredinibacter turnerae TaxID=2426 RepID=UPI00036BED2E|nr:hypothetical protein [Teredinibacter turnerae]
MSPLIQVLDEKYHNVKRDLFGLQTPSVFEIDEKMYNMDVVDKFRMFDVQFEEIYSSPVHPSGLDSEYGKGKDVIGVTYFYRNGEQNGSAVFIVVNSSDEDIVYLKKYISILHELGHVHDFENQINFDSYARASDAVKAEAYAEIFALKYLDRDKQDVVHKFVKSQYAEALKNRKQRSEFYASVHKEINIYISESRLKRWRKF